MHVCTCVCVSVSMCTHVGARVHVCGDAHMHMWMCVCSCVCACVSVHVLTRACARGVLCGFSFVCSCVSRLSKAVTETCYNLNVCVPPSMCWDPRVQRDGIRRWVLWEVIRARGLRLPWGAPWLPPHPGHCQDSGKGPQPLSMLPPIQAPSLQNWLIDVCSL